MRSLLSFIKIQSINKIVKWRLCRREVAPFVRSEVFGFQPNVKLSVPPTPAGTSRGEASLHAPQVHLSCRKAHLIEKPDCNAIGFIWWGMVDSNHRRHSQQIYSLSPLATREIPHIQLFCRLLGAGRRTRTPDLLITNQLLYQLSYTGGSNRTRLL